MSIEFWGRIEVVNRAHKDQGYVCMQVAGDGLEEWHDQKF